MLTVFSVWLHPINPELVNRSHVPVPSEAYFPTELAVSGTELACGCEMFVCFTTTKAAIHNKIDSVSFSVALRIERHPIKDRENCNHRLGRSVENGLNRIDRETVGRN